MMRSGIKHTNHKEKKMAKRAAESRKDTEYYDMIHSKIPDSVRETFFRPAYSHVKKPRQEEKG